MRALDYGNHSVTFFHQEDDKTIIGTKTDVSGAIDRVQRMRQAQINSDALGHCIAAIPLEAVAQWGQQFGLTLEQVAQDNKLLDRCIADYNKFKVHKGWA
jgi:hypothetical protein